MMCCVIVCQSHVPTVYVCVGYCRGESQTRIVKHKNKNNVAVHFPYFCVLGMSTMMVCKVICLLCLCCLCGVLS